MVDLNYKRYFSVFNISLEDAEKIKLFNMSETEFSYQNEKEKSPSFKRHYIAEYSINLIKKVILYRIQEIMDLIFRASEEQTSIYNLEQINYF